MGPRADREPRGEATRGRLIWRRSFRPSRGTSTGRGDSRGQTPARSEAPCASEQMWSHRRHEGTGPKREAPAALDLEAGALDRSRRVTVRVAAARHERPHGIDGALEPGEAGAPGTHVLVEPQLAARAQHPS